MNACPCGYYGDNDSQSAAARPRSSSVISARSAGPLLDRIDIQIEVPGAVPFKELRARGMTGDMAESAKKHAQQSRDFAMVGRTNPQGA